MSDKNILNINTSIKSLRLLASEKCNTPLHFSIKSIINPKTPIYILKKFANEIDD